VSQTKEKLQCKRKLKMAKNNFDVIILGAGGVGLAAAMYSARLGLKTLVLGASHGSELPVGGVITTTNIVENYPGFIRLTGQELAKKIEEHAKSYELVTIREEKVSDVKKEKDGFGNFLSYQVLVDLLYPLKIYDNNPLLPFSNDDWSSPGPGAKIGIKLVLRNNIKIKPLYVITWLRDNQEKEFSRLNLDFKYLLDSKGNKIKLSLANMQNCLCEFHKYIKISNNTGRGRRKFNPKSL